MKEIVVVDQNWGIGKDGTLLVHLPGDLKYFKDQTLGKVVVMGRETLQSLPGAKPLKDRTNIVLSRNKDFTADCTVCHSTDELFKTLEDYDTEEVVIAGGESVYKQLSPYCDRYLVTKIYKEFQADKHFENLDEREDLSIVWESPMQVEKDILYKFIEYRRK
ncbi:MAG: dihydrofolate reductase [Anaerovorax sp.]